MRTHFFLSLADHIHHQLALGILCLEEDGAAQRVRDPLAPGLDALALHVMRHKEVQKPGFEGYFTPKLPKIEGRRDSARILTTSFLNLTIKRPELLSHPVTVPSPQLAIHLWPRGKAMRNNH